MCVVATATSNGATYLPMHVYKQSMSHLDTHLRCFVLEEIIGMWQAMKVPKYQMYI
jgi:hypothetical protein